MLRESFHICSAMQENSEPNPVPKWKTILRKFGIIGFLFFLIKGLIWLVAIFWAGSGILKGCS